MLNFITMTLSVMFGVLLASVVGVIFMMNAKFLKWYTKKILKVSTELANELDNEE